MSDLQLGPFAVTPTGELLPRPAAPRPALRFAWRGRPCRAALDERGLRLAAIAARIPSTAEPALDRRGALAALSGMPRELPEGWRLRLLPDHHLQLEAEAEMDSPPTAVRLISEMVRFVLALDPCLDRMEAMNVVAPAGGGGAGVTSADAAGLPA